MSTGNYKERLDENNGIISNNNIDILNIYNTVNNLPIIENTNALVEDIMENKTAYINGQKVIGTFTLANELNAQNSIITNQENKLNQVMNLLNNRYIRPVDVVTADGTITNMDVIDGKVGYSQGQRIVGTAPVKSRFKVPDGFCVGESEISDLELNNLDTTDTTNMSFMFNGGCNFVSIDVSTWNTSNVMNMRSMFANCNKLTSIDIGNWNTANLVNTSSMFQGCTNLTSINISEWNTANLCNTVSMFQGCYNLTAIDISNWSTNNLTNVSRMFTQCNNLTIINISEWNTANLGDTFSMFQRCKLLTSIDISNWNVYNIKSTRSMFVDCSNLTNIDISNWNTYSLNNTISMFANCTNLTTINISNWDVGNIITANLMFQQCNNLSDSSIDSIINMCINATNIRVKNLLRSNRASLFYQTNIDNTRYQSRWTELDTAGWTY